MERNKGIRLEKFIDDYVVFDFETTGRNIYEAEIIEIGAIKVKNNEIVDSFSTLVKPSVDIPCEATCVNCITNEMVSNCPTIEEVLDAFLRFIDGEILVGHNITSYDLNILYDKAMELYKYEVSNDFVDTLYVAKRCIAEIENFKLTSICSYFGVDDSNAHRALDDCMMTKECYEGLKREYDIHGFIGGYASNARKKQIHKSQFSDETKALQTLQGFLLGIIADDMISEEEVYSLKKWVDDNRDLSGNYPFDRVYESIDKVLEDNVITQEELDELLHLYKEFTAPVENGEHCKINDINEKHFCLTGDFDFGTRAEVTSYLESLGGISDKNVKLATELVIVGSQGSDNWKCGNYGGKIKKAMELKDKGQNITVISEEDLFSCICKER